MSIIEEVADAIGGTPLRVAVWVGVGLTVGLGVGSRGKEPNRGIPNPIDMAIQSGDFDQAERMIRHTFPVSLQAEALAKLRRIQEEFGRHIEKVAQWNKRIGELVAAGNYVEAAAFVKSLEIDSAQRKAILGQIREVEKREREAEKRKKSYAEWDRKLSAFVASGHFDKAIVFVSKLDLPAPHRDAVVTRLREMKLGEEKAAERRKNVETWNGKISRLLSEGRFDEAIAFAGQIDIGPEERDQVVARLRALRREVLGEASEPASVTTRSLPAVGPKANLEGADLNGANLQGKNLSGANLRRANLTRADLQGANLASAMLQGANLSQSKLRNANLTGAFFDKGTKWPDGFYALGYLPAVTKGVDVNMLIRWSVA